MNVFLILLSAAYLCSLSAGEKIMNKDFYGGSLDNWYAYCNSSADNISMKRVGDLYNVLFTLIDGGEELWEVLLTQPIAVRPGYGYHLGFGGVGTGGAKTVDFGLCHNGSSGEGGDGSDDFTYYTGMSATLPGGDYAEFKVYWENSDVDDSNVRVYIQGGGNSIDFQIAWVSVWEVPLDGSDEGKELVANVNFSTGDLEGWYALVNNAGDKVSMKAVDGDYDVLFTLADGGAETWEVQLIQPIGITAGKRYSLAFGGVGTGGSKKIEFGLCHNGATAQGGDGSNDFTYYAGLDATLPSGKYAQYTTVWDNMDIDDNYVRVYLHGGGNAVDFQISWVSVWESPIEDTPVDLHARMNQLGFFRGDAKRAVLTSSTGENFEVRDTGGTAVYSGTLSAASQWEPSGETVRSADFSALTAEGTYALFCNDIRVSGFFTVASNPLEAIAGATIKAYYYQRASTALTSAYAGAWARSAGHSDKSVTVHSSAGSGTVSAPKGWYDAGDYGKYIISSGFTVHTLLALYEHFPEYCAGLKLTIPENGNTVPDILDEVRWNVDWMLAMQDDDGGVYSKLTTLKFAGTVMPEDATAKRYVFMKTTASALDFAAVTAQCSRVYQPFDCAFALKCLEAAKSAYAWAEEHPLVKYVQPADCQTGDYADTRFTDEFLLASVELAIATGDAASYNYQAEHDLPGATIPSWQDVGTMGLFSICGHADVFDA
ncbi:MAG: glycoside hydrolase family 9 protein, partial [Chitinispirillaceae bacterium]|nr:glycoside hydrolase family 9 protein [Chitinispirillaceae bacterium]